MTSALVNGDYLMGISLWLCKTLNLLSLAVNVYFAKCMEYVFNYQLHITVDSSLLGAGIIVGFCSRITQTH